MLTDSPLRAPDGQPYHIITLDNGAGMVVTLMDWGATLLSARVPVADGSRREVLLGCASPQHYLRQTAFLGASVGRYANRIANSRFRLDGETVQLTPSQGKHQLHGGPQGFDKRRWRITGHNQQEARLALDSADGDQGFPGNLHVDARFHLTADHRITMEYRATTDKACPVNLTSHPYFNLDGRRSDVRDHKLQLLADAWLPVDESGIPVNGLKAVAATSFDFRSPRSIRADFLRDADQRKMKGYDHAFLLRAKGEVNSLAACLWSRDEKLQMRLYTSAPALQFYSGNYLATTPSRESQPWDDWQGVALESGFLPDSPNHPEWPQPDCILRPGAEYLSLTSYQFIAR